jgi:hypothetical protein
MTRDFDLIRKLLVFFDEKPNNKPAQHINLGDEYSEELVQYHLALLYEAGLLTAEVERSSTSNRVIRVVPFDLTWEGHEFLARIRNQGIWQQVKTKITSSGGSLAYDLIKQVATRYAQRELGGVFTNG